MSHVLAIANQKGGVGKTTTTVNIGAYLAADGFAVLVVDLDPQANATSSLGVDRSAVKLSTYDALIGNCRAEDSVMPGNRSGLHLIPSAVALAGAEVELVPLPGRERRLAGCLEPLQDRYDYVLIDCPPSLGLLTINALTAAQAVLIPIQCEYLALEGVLRLLETIRMVQNRLNPRLTVLGAVMTMFDGRTNLSMEVVRDVVRYFPRNVFRTVIPRNVRLSEAPSYGQSILEYDPQCKGAAAYRALVDELLGRIEGLEEVGHRRV